MREFFVELTIFDTEDVRVKSNIDVLEGYLFVKVVVLGTFIDSVVEIMDSVAIAKVEVCVFVKISLVVALIV